MDKKQAEQEVLRKAKEVQNAAGKNSGMSGRDLVSAFDVLFFFGRDIDRCGSSNTILSGLKMKRMVI